MTRNLAKLLVGDRRASWRRSAPLGYPVATVLAGLGIGGIALAFGAQKTIENLFGSISLAADQPFRVGDFVKVEDFTGNVERIGMRSTQIRTLDRTLVTLPNGKLADMRIEDFALARPDPLRGHGRASSTARPRSRCGGWSPGSRRLLRAHPKVWPGRRGREPRGLRASSLDVEVLCWFQTTRLRRVPRPPAGGAPRDPAGRRGGGHEPRVPDADRARRGRSAIGPGAASR